MNVGDLIQQLERFDRNIEVVATCSWDEFIIAAVDGPEDEITTVSIRIDPLDS